MTLKECTKEELIYILNRISRFSDYDYHINLALNEIEYKHQMKKIDEAQKWAEIAHDKRKEALELLKCYEGHKFSDIPPEILTQARKLFDEATAADNKWEKINKNI